MKKADTPEFDSRSADYILREAVSNLKGKIDFLCYGGIEEEDENTVNEFYKKLQNSTEDLYNIINLNIVDKAQKINRLNHEIEKLNEFTRLVNETMDIQEVMDFVFIYVQQNFDMEVAWLLMPDDARAHLHTIYFSGNEEKSIKNFLANIKIPTHQDSGSIGRVFFRKRPAYIQRMRSQMILNTIDSSIMQNLCFKSFLIFPLVIKNETIAILVLANQKKSINFNSRNRQRINRFLAQISGAIYSASLLETVKAERAKSDKLLLNILPEKIATELKEKGEVEPLLFESATIMFTDFVSFSRVAETMAPDELVWELNTIFMQFDDICSKHNAEKLKTIGDAFMAAGGLPELNKTHVFDMCLTALEIIHFMDGISEISKQYAGRELMQIRLGIHTGPVVAGVIGKKKFAYDVWGDTVNVASRMESGGFPGRINISETVYELIKDYFECEYRGIFSVKNHGNMKMYFLNRLLPDYSEDKKGIIPNNTFLKKIYV